MQILKCQYCSTIGEYDLIEINKNHIDCHNCKEMISIADEKLLIENTNNEIDNKFENGEIVVIINEEHIWNGELVLICGVRHKHYRIERFNEKMWIPFEWVRQTNDIT